MVDDGGASGILIIIARATGLPRLARGARHRHRAAARAEVAIEDEAFADEPPAAEAVKLLRSRGFKAMRIEDGVPDWRAPLT